MKSTPPESHWPLTILLGLSSLFNLFLPLILVRLLSPDQVGLYKIFFLYSMTGPWLLFSSGFAKGLYFWGGHWGTDREARFQSFSATWSYQIRWSLGILVIGLALVPALKFIPSFLFSDTAYVILLIAGIAITIPSTFYEECRIARGEIKIAGFWGAFWDILRTTALLGAAYYFKTILAVFIAFVGVMFLRLLVSSYLVIKHQFAEFNLKPNAQTKAVWNYAFPLSGAAALAVVFSYGDQFILGYYLSASEFALYSLGCLSIPPLLVLEQSVNKVMIPQLAKAMSKDVSSAWKYVRFAVMDIGLWIIPAAVGLFFFAGPITRLLFTSAYPETETFLKIYSFFYLGFIIPYDAWERAQGRSAWVLKTTAIFALLSLVSTFLGAKFYNAYIALMAYLFWIAGMRVYSLYTMKSKLGWNIRKVLPFYFIVRTFTVSIVLGLGTIWLVQKQTEMFGHETFAMVIWGTTFWILYIAINVPWTLKKERIEKNTKKVLIVVQYLHIGGLERMVLNLSKCVSSMGEWTPSVFVYDNITGIPTMDETFGDVKVYRENKKTGFSLKTVLQIAKLCRQEDINQLHAHDIGAAIYAVLAKFASFGRLRVIYTLHSFVHMNRKRRYKVYEKFVCFFADEVITVSDQLKNIFTELNISKDKVRVIENGVPFPQKLTDASQKTALKAQLLPGKENLEWIVCLARLHPGKGQLECLKIWNELSQTVRDKCLLIFVGGETEIGYTQIIESERNKAKSSEHIVLAGPRLEPTPWLQASDLLLSASLQEGLPLAPLEGLALEIPVVLSDIPGHGMFKGVAHMFPVNDYSVGAKVIEGLILHPKPCQRPEALLRRFSVERMTSDYIKTYRERED
jgi:O-antigen/teichoic acid export membrane protein/glycosyltransferase involved in cell wall biosynthesis